MSDGSIMDAAASEIPIELRALGQNIGDRLEALECELEAGRVARRDVWAGQLLAAMVQGKLSREFSNEDFSKTDAEAMTRQAWHLADLLAQRDPATQPIGVAAAGDE